MTLFLPLEDSPPVSSIPSFVIRPSEPDIQLAKVVKTILKARRIVVICGAGISVKAGIPDFRSSEGLFQTLKRDNPKDALSSGKDLFDASVFNTEHKTALFCQMISRLSDLSQAAQPTPFHRLLRSLDDHRRLLRVYTQNIDAIESKSGLSFGVPEFEGKRGKPRNSTFSEVGDPGPSTAANRTPRCIPLHGTLQQVHCQICTNSFPLNEYLPSLASGVPPECPECTSMEHTRQLVGKRARGVGKLRPSVVLYNEAHKDGEGVGDVVKKDLIGSKGRSGADLLLVVGTSLRVPGTKRMVREFSKAVHSRGSSSKESSPGGDEQASQQQQQQSSQQQQPLKAIYLNLDFPVPTRDWEGVFDAWLQGDAQTFAQMLQDGLDKEVRAKEAAIEKKKKKEEEMAHAALFGTPLVKPKSKTKAKDSPPKRRKVGEDADVSRRKKMVVEIPTPPRSLIRKYHDLTSAPPPTPDPPTPLKLRIPAPARSYTIAGTPSIIHHPPLTPVKKSYSSTIGQLPPTPEYTPGRIVHSPYPAVASLSTPTHRPQPHPLPSSFLTPSQMRDRRTNSNDSNLSLLSDDEYEEAETGSDSDVMQVDDDLGGRYPYSLPHVHSFTPPWRDRDTGVGKTLLRPSEARPMGAGYYHPHHHHHHHLPFPISGSGMCMLPPVRSDGDVGMMDVDLNNFRDQLGTSCLRTTQVEVEVGEGG